MFLNTLKKHYQWKRAKCCQGLQTYLLEHYLMLESFTFHGSKALFVGFIKEVK